MIDTLYSFGYTVGTAVIFAAIASLIAEEKSKNTAVRTAVALYILIAVLLPLIGGSLEVTLPAQSAPEYTAKSAYQRTLESVISDAVISEGLPLSETRVSVDICPDGSVRITEIHLIGCDTGRRVEYEELIFSLTQLFPTFETEDDYG